VLVRSAALAAVLACSSHPTPPTTAVPTTCASIDLVIASDAARPGQACRAWIEATRGRVFKTGVAFSGTVIATTASRGGGLFVTCRHCASGGDVEVTDPESTPPPVLQIGDPQHFYFAHRVYAPTPPKTAFDEQGNLAHILPRDDIAVAAVSNKLYQLRGQIGVLPPAAVKDGAIALEDPRHIAASAEPWAPAPPPNTQVLLLGYPRDLPDREFRGSLVASVGAIVDDATARDRLAHAEADEASVPYDPEVEFVVQARAVSGMSGGGVFDANGRFIGVMVRGATKQVDRTYFTRVVRASFIHTQLRAALEHSDTTLRDRIAPFLPPQF